MIQEYNLMDIVSSYSMHDCYIQHVEYKNGELKLYIDELFPEDMENYDELKEHANKFKTLIVTYKIIHDDACQANITKYRWFSHFGKCMTLELPEFIDYFNKVKNNNASNAEIYHQYFTNAQCIIHFEIPIKSCLHYNNWDSCELNLYVESMKYEWSEEPIESILKKI